MKKILKYLFVPAWALLATNCSQPQASEEAEAPAHSDMAPGGMEEVHLLRQQMDVMEIELGTFRYLSLSASVKANGQLELPPQNKASLSAVMGGRVRSIEVVEGDYVRQGQVLATLEDPRFVEMQERYLSAKSRLAYLENEYRRKKSLHEDSLSSAKAFQEAEAEYRSAAATVRALETSLRMLEIDPAALDSGAFLREVPVRSPINGFVRLVEVNMGKYVQPEEEMFEIVDNDHIHIDLKVYEKDIARVHQGQPVLFTLTSSPDSVFRGSIFAVGKAFERDPKAVVVHAEIDNKYGNLMPGMYVDARIVTRSDTVRALPDDAIVSDGGLHYIFVRKPGEGHVHPHDHEPGADSHHDAYAFLKVEVNTGLSDIGYTEVVPAYKLQDDVQVVTRGAFYLLAEMKKGEGGHGHHH
jgi:cobalt-zinc-cadmium efflux system membrane fusion protein